jgi:hypothetical protein
MPTRTTDDQATHTFRAATIEEAVAEAERTLGRRVSLVGANRIRRGGLGGFFAADLGVEVVVSPIEETVESALERLIATSSSNDKVDWDANRSDPAAAIAAALSAVVAADSAPVESPGRAWLRRRTAANDLPAETNSWYSPPTSDQDRGNRPERLARMAELDRMFGPSNVELDGGDIATVHIDSDPTGRVDLSSMLMSPDRLVANAVPAPSPVRSDSSQDTEPGSTRVGPLPGNPTTASTGSPSLARVERIIEELQALTSAPRLMSTKSGDGAAVAPAEPEVTTPLGSRPAPGMVMRPSWPTATRADDETISRAADGPAATVSLATPRALASAITAPETAQAVAPAPASGVSSTSSTTPELTQRQVELAVSAADALLGSLRREDGVKRLSVRVVLRTGDHDEVAAEAEWDAGA